MITLDYAKPTKVPYQCDNDVIALRFATEIAKANIVPGAPVKLLSTGLVAYPTAVTDFPFGVIAALNNRYEKSPSDDYEVTVITPFGSVVKAEADGVLAIGDLVCVSGFNTTKLEGTYKKVAALGNIVVGMCLEGGADNTDVTIGIFRNPYVHAV